MGVEVDGAGRGALRGNEDGPEGTGPLTGLLRTAAVEVLAMLALVLLLSG